MRSLSTMLQLLVAGVLGRILTQKDLRQLDSGCRVAALLRTT